MAFIVVGIISDGKLPRKTRGRSTNMKMYPAIAALLEIAATNDPMAIKVAAARAITPRAIMHPCQLIASCNNNVPNTSMTKPYNNPTNICTIEAPRIR
jgi:hypothetical protein